MLLPFGEVDLPEKLRDKLSSHSGKVIAGVRPESFEDATLVGDAKEHGSTFTASIDLVESMGSEKYAYFSVKGESVESDELRELAEDSGTSEVPSAGEGLVVARLDAASGAERGKDAELWVDSTKLHLFDPDSGANLGH